nr:CPBP family glutamic-type intramembrane protease [Stakelama marina]
MSCAAFGLAHGLGYGDGNYHFDAMLFALTAIPSLLAVWLRLRSGSVVFPVVIHNFGNAIGLII